MIENVLIGRTRDYPNIPPFAAYFQVTVCVLFYLPVKSVNAFCSQFTNLLNTYEAIVMIKYVKYVALIKTFKRSIPSKTHGNSSRNSCKFTLIIFQKNSLRF